MLTFVILAANAVLAAPDDRFKGGINDGYAQSSVLDKPISIPAGTIIRTF